MPGSSRQQLLALLHSVKETPEDDTPRRILADYLEEQAAPADVARAEFIRLQCELARLEEYDQRRWPAKQRQDELEKLHHVQWLGPLREVIVSGPARAWEFRRGLLHTSIRPKALFSRKLANLANEEAAAWLEGLRLIQLTDKAFQRLPNTAILAQLTTLTLASRMGVHEAEAVVASSPYLQRLRCLDLRGSIIGPEALAVLAGSPRLARITGLVISSSAGKGPLTAQVIAHSPHWTGLTSVEMSTCFIGAEGAQALASSPTLANLSSLYLLCDRIGSAGAETLAASPYLTRLQTLRLVNTQIGQKGASALAVSPNVAGLTTLQLMSNPIGDEGALAIAQSPHLVNLATLNLGNCDLTTRSAAALAATPFTRLAALVLRGNQIEDTAAAALAESPHLCRLQHLDLAENPLSSEVKDHLRRLLDNRVRLS
jgi:uncharacterized protein (TIGR02996 family)